MDGLSLEFASSQAQLGFKRLPGIGIYKMDTGNKKNRDGRIK
jgi:hypothetical protein